MKARKGVRVGEGKYNKQVSEAPTALVTFGFQENLDYARFALGTRFPELSIANLLRRGRMVRVVGLLLREEKESYV